MAKHTIIRMPHALGEQGMQYTVQAKPSELDTCLVEFHKTYPTWAYRKFPSIGKYLVTTLHLIPIEKEFNEKWWDIAYRVDTDLSEHPELDEWRWVIEESGVPLNTTISGTSLTWQEVFQSTPSTDSQDNEVFCYIWARRADFGYKKRLGALMDLLLFPTWESEAAPYGYRNYSLSLLKYLSQRDMIAPWPQLDLLSDAERVRRDLQTAFAEVQRIDSEVEGIRSLVDQRPPDWNPTEEEEALWQSLLRTRDVIQDVWDDMQGLIQTMSNALDQAQWQDAVEFFDEYQSNQSLQQFAKKSEHLKKLFAQGEATLTTLHNIVGAATERDLTINGTVADFREVMQSLANWQPSSGDDLEIREVPSQDYRRGTWHVLEWHKDRKEPGRGSVIEAIERNPYQTVISFRDGPRTGFLVEASDTYRNPIGTDFDELCQTIAKGLHSAVWSGRSKSLSEGSSPTLADVMHRLEEMHHDLGSKLDDLKHGMAIIYKRLSAKDQATITMILEEVRQGRIEQGEIRNELDAVRKVLRHIQTTGLPIADAEVKKSLDDIYQAVNSNLNFHQQLELTLPVIPFLLEYKIGLDAGVDLGAVWKELGKRLGRGSE